MAQHHVQIMGYARAVGKVSGVNVVTASLVKPVTKVCELNPTTVKCTTCILTLVMLNKLSATPTYNFQPIRLLDLDCYYKFIYLMANSADPDQLASSEAN